MVLVDNEPYYGDNDKQRLYYEEMTFVKVE